MDMMSKCFACGEPVSKFAAVCPHCGQKQPSVFSRVYAIVCLIGIIIGVILIAAAGAR